MVLPSGTEAGIAIRHFTLDKRSGRFFAQIVAPAEGPVAGRIKLTGVARIVTEVPVLTRRLKHGEEIRRQDIEWIEVENREISRNTVLDAEEMVGMSLRRPVSPGKMVRSGDLQLPIVIKKNSLVTVELVAGGMQLTIQGRALDNGARGEAIRIVNLQSNKTLTGVVLERDRVAVNHAMQTAGLN